MSILTPSIINTKYIIFILIHCAYSTNIVLSIWLSFHVPLQPGEVNYCLSTLISFLIDIFCISLILVVVLVLILGFFGLHLIWFLFVLVIFSSSCRNLLLQGELVSISDFSVSYFVMDLFICTSPHNQYSQKNLAENPKLRTNRKLFYYHYLLYSPENIQKKAQKYPFSWSISNLKLFHTLKVIKTLYESFKIPTIATVELSLLKIYKTLKKIPTRGFWTPQVPGSFNLQFILKCEILSLLLRTYT